MFWDVKKTEMLNGLYPGEQEEQLASTPCLQTFASLTDEINDAGGELLPEHDISVAGVEDWR